MCTVEEILSDHMVALEIDHALSKYKYIDWRQFVDDIMFYVFCVHKDFSRYSKNSYLRADLQKKVKQRLQLKHGCKTKQKYDVGGWKKDF